MWHVDLVFFKNPMILFIALYGKSRGQSLIFMHICAYFSVTIELCYLGPSPMSQEFNSTIGDMLTWSILRTHCDYLLPYMQHFDQLFAFFLVKYKHIFVSIWLHIYRHWVIGLGKLGAV